MIIEYILNNIGAAIATVRGIYGINKVVIIPSLIPIPPGVIKLRRPIDQDIANIPVKKNIFSNPI